MLVACRAITKVKAAAGFSGNLVVSRSLFCYPEYVLDHFQNLLNSLLVHNLGPPILKISRSATNNVLANLAKKLIQNRQTMVKTEPPPSKMA